MPKTTMEKFISNECRADKINKRTHRNITTNEKRVHIVEHIGMNANTDTCSMLDENNAAYEMTDDKRGLARLWKFALCMKYRLVPQTVDKNSKLNYVQSL